MSDTQRPLHDGNILDLIQSICKNGESGRLEILAGAIQGELSFKDGKLVDARVGHLRGFRAINAAAAMRDARVSFDPAFAPLASGGITASERVVLKQFFGIETTDSYVVPAVMSLPEETAQVLDPEAVADAPEEVTIVRSNVTSEIPIPIPPASRFSFPRGVAVAALALILIAVAAALISRSRERTATAGVASVESSAPRAEVQQQPAPRVTQSAPESAAIAKAAPASPRVRENSQPQLTAQNLSGKWNIVNVVETTSYQSFKNLKIGFDLAIQQSGKTFTGIGRKISENGRSLPANSRTPIQVKGSINGNRIEATFFEEGTARKTNGKFVWRIDRAGRGLTGTFASNAARARGRSAATREL